VTVTNPGNQTGTVNTPVSLTVHASGGSGTFTWSATGLPAGLSIATGTGVISGTPTAAGTSTVTVTATSGDQSGIASFTWTVQPGGGGGGNCAGVAEWSAAQAYSPNDRATHAGHLWNATWWSTGAEPGSPGAWAVWSDGGAC
jgi:hypothetical protein